MFLQENHYGEHSCIVQAVRVEMCEGWGPDPLRLSKTPEISTSVSQMDEYYFLPPSLLESMKVMTAIKLDSSFMCVTSGDAVKCGLSKPCK